MTRCKFLIVLGVIALLAQGASAQVMVTFRLNTSTVNAFDITAESMVQVRGSILPITWGDDSVDLEHVEGDIWEAVVTFDAGQTGNTLEYKFFAEDWEGGDNKTLVLDQDVVLDLAYFGNGYTPPFTPTDDIDLWFRVSMESNALFNPDTDEVGMRGAGAGSDLDWGANLVLAREAESFYYSGQVMVPADSAGGSLEYKFVRGAGPDEWEDLPEGNRMLTVPAEDMTVVWAYWNNEEPSAAVIDTGIITWQADMTEMLANGWFDAGTEWISVRGSFEGWGNQEPMTPDLLNPTIYKWDYEVIAEVGSTISWKFKAFPDENWLDGGWEIGGNHEFPFMGAEVLDPRVPNILPAGDSLLVDVTLNFACDVNNAINFYTGEPFPSIGSVWAAGDFGQYDWPSWDVDDTTSMIRLYDNGTNGDVAAGDGIWSGDIALPAGTASTLLYKYSIWYPGVEELNDGTAPMDNEAGFAQNHAAVLDLEEEFQYLVDEFGSQPVHEIKGAVMPEAVALGTNWPNPFAGSTYINYTIPTSGMTTLRVYDLSGRSVYTVQNGHQEAGTYAATWNGRDMANRQVTNGTYLMRLESASGSATRKVVVLR